MQINPNSDTKGQDWVESLSKMPLPGRGRAGTGTWDSKSSWAMDCRNAPLEPVFLLTPLRKSAGLGLEGTRTCSSGVCKFRLSRFMQKVDAVAAEGGSRRGRWPVGTHSSNVSGLTATSQTPTQIFSRHISAHVCMCVCAYDMCACHTSVMYTCTHAAYVCHTCMMCVCTYTSRVRM